MGAYAMVLRGSKAKTIGGLTAKDLTKNKNGKIVSKKQSAQGKKHPWMQAVAKARKALKITGFVIMKKGTPCTPRRRSSTTRERNMRTCEGTRRHQLQVWGFPHLWSAGAPASTNCSDR